MFAALVLVMNVCCASRAGAELVPVANVKMDAVSFAALERRANQILAGTDNIVIRSEINPVFEFADRCVAAGDTNKAISVYTRALEHKPWNLSAQLALARLLKGEGNLDEANQKAELVWKYAETDLLLGGAAEVLGKSYESKLTSEALQGKRGVVLSPIGDVDAWLIREVRDGLKEMLKMPVVIQPNTGLILQPDRSPLGTRASEMRQRLEQMENHPAMRGNLRALAIDRSAWKTDEGAITVVEKLMGSEKDPTQLKNFREEMRSLRALGGQWDAEKLLNDMQISARRVQRTEGSDTADASEIVVLGITKLDLFSNQSRYVFGISRVGENRAVISYRRYTAAAYDTVPNRERLQERTLKQALSSIGLAYGLTRCSDPTCARAYANSLDEHDAKEVKLCGKCRAQWERKFAR
jgi:predicted Zn-dependent protease